MIAPEDDDRVVGAARFFQRVEHAADLRVHVAHRREVSADQRQPLVGFLQELQPRLGQFPVQIPREAGRVVAVVVAHRGQLRRLGRIEVEPLLRRVTRHVRQAETAGDEERFVLRRGFNRADRRGRDLIIAAVFVALGKRSPVHRRVHAGRLHERHVAAADRRRRAPRR